MIAIEALETFNGPIPEAGHAGLARAERSGLWSIVLAGGEGQRVRPLVERWLKRHQPKQYCAFMGRRSMLEHTLERADIMVAPEKHRIVINRAHADYALPQLSDRPDSSIIMQPANRDTAAGVFLPLTYIRAVDPTATVLLFPSDHFVYPAVQFVEAVSTAVEAARATGRLVLLGAQPDAPEPEYGWIFPATTLGRFGGRPVRSVRSFVEKPSSELAARAFENGGLWNTLVAAVKLETLWALGRREMPDLVAGFEWFGAEIGGQREHDALEALYRTVPARNFSSDLLAHAAGETAVLELEGVIWSDWGKPERIVETARRMGRSPAFPLECLEPEFSDPGSGTDRHSVSLHTA
jgi:mannose-1-phosphate guanylyltransferase